MSCGPDGQRWSRPGSPAIVQDLENRVEYRLRVGKIQENVVRATRSKLVDAVPPSSHADRTNADRTAAGNVVRRVADNHHFLARKAPPGKRLGAANRDGGQRVPALGIRAVRSQPEAV